MKKSLIVFLVLILVVAGIWLAFFKGKKSRPEGPKQQPLGVSKHSDIFNLSAQKMIGSYYSLTEALVISDTSSVTKYAQELKVNIDSLRLDQLKKDTAIFQTATGILANTKAEIDGLLKDGSLEEKRLAFNSLTQYVYDLFRTIRYDQAKIYFQECPMAFGEDQAGNWLSTSPAVRNPYTGGPHPKNKEGMLTCGGPKDTLNFLLKDSTKQ